MTSEIDRMVELFKEMRLLLVELEPLIADERQALIDLEFDMLHEIAAEKNNLSRELLTRRDQAKKLVQAQGRMAGQEGVETVPELLKLLPPSERDELHRHYISFKSKAQEIEFRNAANKALAEEGMLVMEESMNQLARLTQEGVTYQPTGAQPAAGQLPTRICREV